MDMILEPGNGVQCPHCKLKQVGRLRRGNSGTIKIEPIFGEFAQASKELLHVLN